MKTYQKLSRRKSIAFRSKWPSFNRYKENDTGGSTRSVGRVLRELTQRNKKYLTNLGYTLI